MKFITLSNRSMDDDSGLSIRRQPRLLRQSCQRYGVPMENICPIGHPHEWTGRIRQQIVVEYLKKLPADGPVLLTDAWDSFVAGTPDQFEAAFREINSPVIISPECNLWPPETKNYIPPREAPTRWKYACGGGWAGYAQALLDMFTAEDYWPAWALCDQAAFDDWVARHSDTATIDYWCKLFVCIYDDGKARPHISLSVFVKDGKLFNKDTNTNPLVCHGGGGFANEAARLWDTLKGRR